MSWPGKDHTKSPMWNRERKGKRNSCGNLPDIEQPKMSMGGYEPKRSQDCLNLNKKSLMIIVGILMGHCSLNDHRGKIAISTDTDCRFCGWDDETSIHILRQCPALVQSRLTHQEEGYITRYVAFFCSVAS